MYEILMAYDFISFGIVCLFMVFDYISGIAKGLVKKEFSSSILRLGLWHKLAYVIALIVVIALEMFCFRIGFTIPIPLYSFVLLYIAFTEIVSILENLGEINPKLQNNGFMKLFSFVKESDAIEQVIEVKGSEDERN